LSRHRKDIMPAKRKAARQNSAAKSRKQAKTRSEADRKAHQNDLLDEALRETFPASDPVSVVEVK
jgi:hypothetical protein